MAQKLLWGSLVLTPLALAAHYLAGVSDTVTFVLAAAALVPLAWLIGEATEHVAEHTGPGIGGFVNASFGNAPELIIALLAIHDGLPNVVRGSITGSVVSNLLLVLGAAMLASWGRNPEGRSFMDVRSTLLQLGLVGFALALFVVPSLPGWTGNPERNSLYVVTIPVAAVLLGLYVVITILNLRRHRDEHSAPAAHGSWKLRTGFLVLGAATVATAFVAELLVHSLDAFGRSLGLSQFFVSAVIVAIVGNAAEHGGAIVVARRGNMRLASEIAVSSSTQVAVFVTPVVALLSFAAGTGLPLAFRPIELATMAIATVAVAAVCLTREREKERGFALIGLYVVLAGWFVVAGDRGLG